MNLAFYYHIPVGLSKHQHSLPGYIGLFVDALARQVDQLYLIAHTDNALQDYTLTSDNIVLIDLGKKTSSLKRGVFPSFLLNKVNTFIHDIDVFLVRAPSPLAPSFSRFRNQGKKVVYYLVGDYYEGALNMKITSLREWLVKQFLKWNHHQLSKAIHNYPTIVNSQILYSRNQAMASEIALIPTTTLTNQDFVNNSKEFRQPYILKTLTHALLNY